jgi:hypothetical protein
MNGLSAGKYCGHAKEAFTVGGWRGWWLIATWLSYPVCVATVLHPSDVIGFQDWMQGLAVPHEFTSQQQWAGELSALFALASFSLSMFMATVLLYRKAGFWFRLWPLVAVVVGLCGNIGWWIAKQHFDPVGALLGLAPLSLSVLIFAVCEKQGREFVFGKDAKPAKAGA